jgi:hypothetical protein
MNGPEVLVPLGFFFSAICIVVGLPLARAYARRMDRATHAPPLPAADIVARLERIEQGVEAMSVEVERIAQGQRFTTQLLAERNAAPLPAGALNAPALNAPAQHAALNAPPGTTTSAQSNTEPGVNPADGTVLLPAARRTP